MSGGRLEYLTQASLLRLLAVMALIIAPHLGRLPTWEVPLVIGMLGWRALAVLRQWRMPPRWIKVLITLLAFAGVQYSYGRTHGQAAGVALFTVMLTFKLMEMRDRRDVMVTVFLMYFVLITHFLYSQEIWTILYLLVCATCITAVLIEASHPGAALPPRVTARLAGRQMAEALPLMVVFFLLFPRIPGPLWGLPSDGGAVGRTGLSDSMAPGDIASLIESDQPAFRVEFDGAAPPKSQMYWRGPVFWFYNGAAWNTGFRGDGRLVPEAELRGEALRYRMTLEPSGQHWITALELVDRTTLPKETGLNTDYLLQHKRRIGERVLLEMQSYTDFTLEPELSDFRRQQATRLPQGFNPRTLELAESWRERGLDDAAIVETALQRFRNQPFVYTLQPPALGRHAVDEFLFETRRGFCEHYASSFTVLMRAAGVPARVVTGYQGGDENRLGDYFVVRQSDAHAWSEVWLEGQGWVRVDPTGAVAPDRIELGIESALSAADGLPSFLSSRTALRYWLEARWDLANAYWNRWVLAFGPEMQQALLERFGLVGMRSMIIALTVAVTVMLSVFGLLALRRSRPSAPPAPPPMRRSASGDSWRNAWPASASCAARARARGISSSAWPANGRPCAARWNWLCATTWRCVTSTRPTRSANRRCTHW